MKSPLGFVFFVCVAAAGFASTAFGQVTVLQLDSEPGDYIGAGQQLTLTPLDGNFSVSTNFDGGVSVNFGGGTHRWNLDFAPRQGEAFAVGAYTGATRFPFQGPQEPGLSVTGDGRGCNRNTGRFVVLELERGPGNTITRFAADFEQHCEGAQPALFGSIRIASTVTIEPRVALGSVVVSEGDFGLRDVGFEVFLTRRAASQVSFAFATRDDTALAGTDYLAAVGTGSLPPGTVSTRLEAFALTNDVLQGERRFFLDLSAVTGAPVATPTAAARILEDDGNRNVLFLDSTPFDFIGQGVFLPGEVLSPSIVEVELGRLDSEVPMDCASSCFECQRSCRLDVLLRPDDVIHDDASEVKAEVVAKAFRGAEFLYTLRLASGAQVLSLVPSHHNHAIGEMIGIRLDVDHVVTFTQG